MIRESTLRNHVIVLHSRVAPVAPCVLLLLCAVRGRSVLIRVEGYLSESVTILYISNCNHAYSILVPSLVFVAMSLLL